MIILSVCPILFFKGEMVSVGKFVFGAKNDKHLLEMENYISSDLRPRKGMTMVAKLPTFIKIKRNKEIVLKILEKWKKSYK
ncbi:hypothetical protein CCAN11_1500003 [Capnocytophaga canimorsus]|uniref:Uncharacterized protein n=1 Tax=Capnocytophaga canimorsus TaxID=28188 RepID=A0A0B7IAJ9_9FLAO|nr:hypothetical protein CCAN11_1500003 [Capnocytophaga canimorsus]